MLVNNEDEVVCNIRQAVYECGGENVLTITFIVIGVILVLLLFWAYISYLGRKLALEQGLFKGIVNHAKIIIIVSQSDGTVVLFNKYAEESTGFTLDEMKGKKLYDTMLLKDKGEQIKNMLDNNPGTDTIQNAESHIIGKNGEYLDILWNMNILNGLDGKPLYIISMGIDITERKKTEQKLRVSYEELDATHRELAAADEELKQQYDDLRIRETELKRSEERYRLIIEGVNDGVWDWDGKEGKVFMSQRCKTLLGYGDNDRKNNLDAWIEMLNNDAERFSKFITESLSEPQKKHFQIKYRTREKNGKYKWLLTKGKAIWNTEGIPVRMAGSVTDITEQKLTEEKIHNMAYFDALTGLPNRVLFMDRLSVAIDSAQRKNRMVAIYFLDLDNFKTVNDTLGHSFGDELLSTVSRQLKMKMRKSDTIARLGGDEFIMIQSNVKELEEVTQVALRIKGIFQQPWILDGHEFYVTASIGISVYPNDGTAIDVLMKNADAAMYRAKETGKNNFQLFTSELNSRIIEKLTMENSLRKAVERNEMILYYQPQIDLKTGEITSVEALIRWQHPEMGLITPAKFIPLAEESGLIIPIGEWVMRTACKQNILWHEQGYTELCMSVNLSAKQFQQRNLVDMLRGVLDETGMKPEWLELEITESIVMKDLDYTIPLLHKIKEMGVGISLNDFGTGYSSLNYLKRLPITNLKIGKSFVNDITAGTNEAVIARTLISLAHDMKLKVTAEGVETAEQLKFLENEDCDLVQGHLLSLPKPADELMIAPEKSYFAGNGTVTAEP